MKIAIDARGAYLYNGTGIGTYTNNLITNMINMFKELVDNYPNNIKIEEE